MGGDGTHLRTCLDVVQRNYINQMISGISK